MTAATLTAAQQVMDLFDTGRTEVLEAEQVRVFRTGGRVRTVRFTPVRSGHRYRLCDDRCVYAQGDDCSCSCGGQNHGVGYAGTPVADLAEWDEHAWAGLK